MVLLVGWDFSVFVAAEVSSVNKGFLTYASKKIKNDYNWDFNNVGSM